MNNYKNILVLKTGALGDIILASVSFQTLRRAFPTSEMYLLTQEQFRDVVAECPLFKNIYYFTGKYISDFFKVLVRLRKQNFDLVLDLQGNLKSNFLCALIGGRKRVGFNNSFPGKLFLSCSVPRRLDNNPVERQFRLLKKLNIQQFTEKPVLWISEKERKNFYRFLQQYNIAGQNKGLLKNKIILHPSASKHWVSKQWPQERFAELADILIKKGYQVIFVGDHYAHTTIQNILSMMKEIAIDLSGKTSVSQLGLLLKTSDLLITNDSGPMHIGAAAGTNVIAIFGPSDPVLYCPPGIHYIYKKATCSPCNKKVCSDFQCMKSITVNDVIKKSEEFNLLKITKDNVA